MTMAAKENLYLPYTSNEIEPIDTSGGYGVRPGLYNLRGATALPGGIVNFTVISQGASAVDLVLFRPGGRTPYARLPFPDTYRVGSVWSMMVFGLDISTFEYAYQVDGPYDPKAGLLFDRKNYLLDPYARAVTGQSIWGRRNDQFYKARVVQNDFDWKDEKRPDIPVEDLIIYEAHVRGFTRDPSSGVKERGTYLGMMRKIPYLKELGVNAVELMPIFEFDENRDERTYNGQRLLNYWGYNTVSFFTPNTSYAYNRENNHEGDELRMLIRELNRNGIEVILDVVFNHTAEGNEKGPSFCFKGFDNNIYYMLTPDGYYYNFSGCGNTMNCNHPFVQEMILECLRYWVIDYHVSGFRFDLASILGRDNHGRPLSDPPLLRLLAEDPVLSHVKLIAEAWDAGGLYQVGSFSHLKHWAEWNGRYRDDMRDYLKGNLDMTGVAVSRITGSTDLYNPDVRGFGASVNFLNCHDGFTLYDMYSYNDKHNEMNGEGNRDGSNDNRSWNCGAEGETDDPAVNALRRKMAANAIAVLMMSRGTPMILAGDEFLNSQQGNNNSYCQDNPISWLNWGDLQKNRDHFAFVKFMIAFRKAHPAIHRHSGGGTYGLPDITVSWPVENEHALAVVYAGPDDAGHDDAVGLAVNVFWEEQDVVLPEMPQGVRWAVAADTTGYYLPDRIEKDGTPYLLESNVLHLAPRSAVVLRTVTAQTE